jgi:Ni/Fe-hydrogenase subunit HybB-like protein
MSQLLWEALRNVQGFIYPNEVEVSWTVLIALYPYITGLVAGAFTVASLVKVFKVEEVKPVYRLSLLTALAFLIAAPLPLIAHIGHPERAFEIMFTPHLSSAMAVFGFIYAWYLFAVLLIEIYYDYRKDIVSWAQTERGFKQLIYRILTLGEYDVSKESLKKDEDFVYKVTVIGLPSAALLHGYVGFIFGSVKANLWWSSPLMPFIFLASAMVSGIALVMLLYMAGTRLRGAKINMRTLDVLAGYLLYTYIIDFSLELVELGHIFYSMEEGIDTIAILIADNLFVSYVIIQIGMGTLLPIVILVVFRRRFFNEMIRMWSYVVASILTLAGVFAMRWNVVIGGQLYSKTFKGFSYYVMEIVGRESALMTIALFILPLVILYILVKILPPWEEVEVLYEGADHGRRDA